MPSDHDAPEAAANSVEAAPFSVGTTLKEAREHHGLSVEDVSNRIKFAPRQIEALEADDFAHLPETAFLRGFVRSYARLLQLDPTPLLDALPHEPVNTVPPEVKSAAEMPYPDIYTERKYNIIWLAAALAVALILAMFAWLFGDKPKEHHAAQSTQDTRVERLDLPAAVPVSAVPDAEPLMVKANTEKPDVEKLNVVEKPAVAEKSVAEKPKVAEKSAAEKLSAEKPGTEKPKAAEVKKVPQVVPPAQSAVVQPAKPVVASPAKPVAVQPAKPVVAPPAKPVAVQPAKPVEIPPVKPTVKPLAANNASGAAIRVAFNADSWVEIKDKDGKIVFSQLGHGGTEQSAGGTPPFSVTVGYSSGVKLYYKGKQVDLAPYARSEVAHLTLE